MLSPGPLRLQAITSHPRLEVVSQLTSVLNEVGWIVDFHQFSNLSLTVLFEMPRTGVPRLRSGLAAIPFSLLASSLDALSRIEQESVSSASENLSGSIQVTFVHSEPDLRIPVPAVPG